MSEALNQPLPQEGNTPAPQQQTDTAPVGSTNAELAEQMRLSLSGYQNFPEQVQPSQPQPQPQIDGTIQVPTPSGYDEYETVDVDNYLKEFGFDSEDVFKQEIESLRALKNAPPQPQIQYASEDSRRLHEAIVAGKRDEILSILNKQAQIERLVTADVTKDSAADIVKMGMQLKYKDLTPDEINYKFNKQFSVPPKPVFNDLSETEDEYNQKVASWQEIVNDRTMELMIEAKLSKPEIEQAKSKIELPPIQQAVDDDYLQYKEQVDKNRTMAQQAVETYQKYSPKQFETKVPFVDEANKINFEFQYEPDQDSFNETKELVSDMDKFMQKFTNSDGSPNREAFFKFVYAGLNANKMITEAIKQGGNARFKSLVPNNSVNNGLQRQLAPNVELSELDKEMQHSFAV